MSLLQTRSLSISMPGRSLVHGLDWTVNPGELWCLIGPNGAGKTTLLHVLCALRAPASGEVLLDGRALSTIAPGELARLRGLMPQQQFDAFSHSVLDTVQIGRTPWRIGRQWDSGEDLLLAQQALRRAGAGELAQRDVLRLSGGERQRVALAALLAQDPRLMMLDEPTSHQDIAHQLAMMETVRGLLDHHAVIMTCHDINLAARYATHVLMLSGGRYWLGAAGDVLTVSRLAAAFHCTFEERDGVFVASRPAPVPG